MILQIADVLEPADLAVVSEAARAARFEDGRLTAGPGARSVKRNQQAAADPAVRGVLRLVEERLSAHPLVRAAALPRAFVRLTLSRYEAGMHYGNHTDDALIAGQRTDLSFTLGLDSGRAYEGGALVLVESSGERAWTVRPGELLLYPSTYLHRVEPVTEGTRLVVIGWITSRVRSAEQRELLFDLARAVHHERETRGKTEQYDRLERTRQNLLRHWAD